MHIFFLLKESFSGYRRFKISFILSIFSLFVALSLLGLFAYLFLNAKFLVDDVKNRVEVEAFYKDTITETAAKDIQEQIKSWEGISDVHLITKGEAKNRFLSETGIDFKDILTFNPLPASITIEVNEKYLNREFIENLRIKLLESGAITDVVFNQQFLDLIESRASTFQTILIVVFSIVMLATIILISNTIRLALYNKIDVINTMRLVGATHNFIKLPFLIEGIIVGVLSGIFAAAAVFVFNYAFNKILIVESYVDFRNLLLLCLSLIILGGIFGFFGSFISIKKFFKQSVFPK
ncbi:MAG: FtsX-like permease family protein [Ignavibacteria bacterium]|nr:FtsX-like permease family protein [Ignavibacteria bacterium]